MKAITSRRQILISYLCSLSLCLYAQSWSVVSSAGGQGNDRTHQLLALEEGLVVAFTSDAGFDAVNNLSFVHQGADDIGMLWTDEDGNIEALTSIGGSLDEAWGGVATEDGQRVTTVLTFRDALFVNGDVVFPNALGRHLWVAQWDDADTWQTIALAPCEGGVKAVKAVCTEDGKWIISGTVIGRMVWDGVEIGTAGVSSLFAIKLAANGQYQSHTTFPFEGVVTLKDQLIVGGDSLILYGDFKGTIYLPTDTLETQTPDFDVYFVGIDVETMQPYWQRRSGGVHDALARSLTRLDEDTWVAVGTFLGLMEYGTNDPIFTMGFNYDAFALYYTNDGSPIRAQKWGNENDESANSLAITNGQLFLVGNYTEATSIQGWSLPSGGNLSAWAAAFDGSTLIWAASLRATTSITLSSISASLSGDAWLAGHFQGTITAPSSFASKGLNDLVWVKAGGQLTNFSSTPISGGQEIWEGAPFRCWDTAGKLIDTGIWPLHTTASHLPKGIYFIEIMDDAGLKRKAVFSVMLP